MKVCISNSFPGDAEAAGLGTTLEKPVGLRDQLGHSDWFLLLLVLPTPHLPQALVTLCHSYLLP